MYIRFLPLMPRLTLCLAALAIAAGCVWNVADACGQDDDESEPPPFLPGLVAEYSNATQRIERIDGRVGYNWGRRPPDPRLDTGPFRAVWKGNLLVNEPGTYELHVFVAGRVRIRLRDAELLDQTVAEPAWLESAPTELPFGYHAIEIEYAATENPARIALYWLGPTFAREPIAERYFYHPGSAPTLDNHFERGRLLTHALRCGACHELPGQTPGRPALDRPAPALDRLATTVRPKWLLDWLLAGSAEAGSDHAPADRRASPELARRMPWFSLTREEADALAAWLTQGPGTGAPAAKNDSPPDPSDAADPERSAGERLFLTIGCLACHRIDELGESGLFGGGDLSHVGDKRPPEFFDTWLADPALTNRHHQMPVFPLQPKERRELAAFLSARRRSEKPAEDPSPTAPAESVVQGRMVQGRTLFEQLRCVNCHLGPDAPTSPRTKVSRLSSQSDWSRACSGSGGPAASADLRPNHTRHQPWFRQTDSDQQAIRNYLTDIRTATMAAETEWNDRSLVEHNCLACHARGPAPGLAAQLSAVIEKHPEIAPAVAAMTPPSLTSVGDKLRDDALEAAIRQESTGHRPWLQVRMPRFRLQELELHALVQELIEADRIPTGRPSADSSRLTSDTQSAALAGRRLVTADGFGCASCHQIGQVVPPLAPLAARGPDLTLLAKRIRREWFDRWVRNPSRIVPRMEMPSVQRAVRGVLDDNVDAQLDAVWQVLNEPGFEPPEPNPIQILRQSGVATEREPAVVLTDVLVSGTTRIQPLLIGLPNRHNLLFDFEPNQLASWTMGDVARQRTKGKSWFWESAGTELLRPGLKASDLTLIRPDGRLEPLRSGQFATELDVLEHVPGGVRFTHRLHFAGARAGENQTFTVSQTVTVAGPFAKAAGVNATGDPTTGVRREIQIVGSGSEASPDRGRNATSEAFELRVVSPELFAAAQLSADRRRLVLPGGDNELILLAPETAVFREHGELRLAPLTGEATAVGATLEYRTRLPVDQFPIVVSPQVRNSRLP